jgi:glyoxylase-like metal-dependent hydrolase (beta-lactamase superfamily II)
MIHEPLPGLFLVSLNLPREGFGGFIGAWVLRRGGATVLVDPGPRATAPELFSQLAALGVRHLDALLLTHVHIDHAGGAGLLAERYPEARVICHPKGIPHLADPAKLWVGSLQVLGELARAYGEIAAVPAQRLEWGEELRFGELRVQTLETPGHAAHHACFRAEELLFVGEAAGIRQEAPGGLYARPATPPPFLYEEFRASLQRASEAGPGGLCFGHGGYAPDAGETFRGALEQLDLWVRTVEEGVRSRAEDLPEAVFRRLLDADPLFARYRELPPDVQARERYFFGNAIQGMRKDAERRLGAG